MSPRLNPLAAAPDAYKAVLSLAWTEAPTLLAETGAPDEAYAALGARSRHPIGMEKRVAAS